ncbi:MAG: Alanyl-tRNA synthetase [uncultured Chthoniobacterales bacterium]|uniref:Alanine--tRNA ligase n=1 Tax=uncultured Chthoniobacterales bacterium TaxID=1836801 RepID=A0A6J4IJZ4_9BACT|nr:MAG: Alanyl-tRNA synthetase [uncultured Chthoniobacterales bacterium]
MTSAQIRQSFLDFFREKQHTIVPSSSLLPDAPNLLFTNAGMNQFVPIFLAQQSAPWNPPRTADTQKCIRAGGKHNDLDDVGLDTYHHTFFEMLGNWSFGDYFKKEAIEWAWELVVERWKLPPQRLYATVYKPGPGDPSEFDQEAHDQWARLFERAGLDPAVQIVNGNKKDNFWMMGDTGPCGPCSELHIDLTPNADTRGSLVNVGDPRCMEIWNLVFIQFNANPDGTFSPLPARHVDTGMGFERVTALIQNTKHFTDFSSATSNYETDVFRPIFDEIEKLSGKRYGSTLPKAGSAGETEQEKNDIAFRVIADHIRTLSFAIADGIQPSNEGRGYVLRRILRRAVRYGRTLGFHEPFFYKLVDVLVVSMSDVFPELRTKQQLVRDTLRREEEAFNKTLDKGIALFESEAANVAGTISGPFAFRLYDEQGFPLDLTELMARERGLTVDVAGFDSLMEQQRTRARAAQKKETITVSGDETLGRTEFVGYEQPEADARVVETIAVKDKVGVVLDITACYAEMGGQVGDTGELSQNGNRWTIANTQKAGNAIVHLLAQGEPPAAGAEVKVHVDVPRRRAIERHHTVTHLLHWALHEVVSRDAAQKGSYVGPEKLTFDFNSAALTSQQLLDVERLVNERIVESAHVSWTEMPYTEVKARPEIMQFFGDKYGDTVRVVQIGGQPRALDGYSMELCGGTHVRGTGEIGLFRIVGEAAIAAGVRRVEAVAGLNAYEQAKRDQEFIRSLAGKLNSPINDLEKRIESMLAHQKALEKTMKSLEQKQATETARQLAAKAETIGETSAIIENLGAASGDQLQAIADALKQQQFRGVVVLAGAIDGTVALAASVAPELVAKLQAGKIIQAIAPIVGGKGGGRPDSARGAGKDASKVDAALEHARSLLA